MAPGLHVILGIFSMRNIFRILTPLSANLELPKVGQDPFDPYQSTFGRGRGYTASPLENGKPLDVA